LGVGILAATGIVLSQGDQFFKDPQTISSAGNGPSRSLMILDCDRHTCGHDSCTDESHDDQTIEAIKGEE